LIVANQVSRDLSFHRIDDSTGELTFLGIQPTDERPFWVGNEQSL
jgi:6-phosphogluconolactonase (cycloisomerase 2 family)